MSFKGENMNDSGWFDRYDYTADNWNRSKETLELIVELDGKEIAQQQEIINLLTAALKDIAHNVGGNEWKVERARLVLDK